MPIPWCALSPAKLLMGRTIRIDVPQFKDKLIPKWSHIKNFRTADKRYKESQKRHYDQRHRVRSLPWLPDDQPVWVETRGQQVPGRILHAANTPKSYVIETPSGQLRRNHSHLRVRSELDRAADKSTNRPSRALTRSQTGTTIRPPDRLRY